MSKEPCQHREHEPLGGRVLLEERLTLLCSKASDESWVGLPGAKGRGKRAPMSTVPLSSPQYQEPGQIGTNLVLALRKGGKERLVSTVLFPSPQHQKPGQVGTSFFLQATSLHGRSIGASGQIAGASQLQLRLSTTIYACQLVSFTSLFHRHAVQHCDRQPYIKICLCHRRRPDLVKIPINEGDIPITSYNNQSTNRMCQ